MPKQSGVPVPIQSTAGAVPVKNEKGQVSMQKVKVSRYVSGKRPEYAPRSSSEDESDEEEFISHQKFKTQEDEGEEEEEYPREDMMELEKADPRMRRLMAMDSTHSRGRRIAEPEVMDLQEDSDEDPRGRRHESDSESEEEELDEREMETRRAYLRQKVLEKREEEELLTKEEEKESETEESESEYEEYTDSEEEARPRLKPVFVRKDERVTVKDKDNEETSYKQAEEQTRVKQEERRKETLKILEEEIRKEKNKGLSDDEDPDATIPKLTDVNTDEENEEAEYEAWKIRELKRLKKSRDERDAYRREQAELERIHGMTDEERRLEMKLKPKVMVNKATKGKYKFLQKYYHRGVFFLDREDDVYRRDFSQPTLEDHFDKTILPKVMQVKNFGRSGRTKYTHLVDQDTTNFESAWVSETAQNLKFHTTQAAGIRQQFMKPSFKRGKVDNTKSLSQYFEIEGQGDIHVTSCGFRDRFHDLSRQEYKRYVPVKKS